MYVNITYYSNSLKITPEQKEHLKIKYQQYIKTSKCNCMCHASKSLLPPHKNRLNHVFQAIFNFPDHSNTVVQCGTRVI